MHYRCWHRYQRLPRKQHREKLQRITHTKHVDYFPTVTTMMATTMTKRRQKKAMMKAKMTMEKMFLNRKPESMNQDMMKPMQPTTRTPKLIPTDRGTNTTSK